MSADMSEDVYTVEQFAERLKLHPKTVLRFIREGRLRAVKVGRSYRILRSDLEAFGIVSPYAVRSEARTTAIVDVPNLTSEQAQELARIATSVRKSPEPGAAPLRIDVAHDPVLRQVKLVLIGSPGDVAAMLRMVEVWLERIR